MFPVNTKGNQQRVGGIENNSEIKAKTSCLCWTVCHFAPTIKIQLSSSIAELCQKDFLLSDLLASAKLTIPEFLHYKTSIVFSFMGWKSKWDFPVHIICKLGGNNYQSFWYWDYFTIASNRGWTWSSMIYSYEAPTSSQNWTCGKAGKCTWLY